MTANETQSEFSRLLQAVDDAFTSQRQGDLQRLGQNQLAYTDLVTPHLTHPDNRSTTELGMATASLLHWLVSELRPPGDADWLDPTWRNYNLLNSYFFERQRASDVAERFGIVEQTFYDWRRQALTAAAQIASEELGNPTRIEERAHFARVLRFHRASGSAQKGLQLLSLLADGETLSDQWLAQHVPDIALGELTETHLTTSSLSLIDDRLRSTLRETIPGDSAEKQHLTLAELCDDADQTFYAARHYILGGRPLAGAELLLSDSQRIRNEFSAEQIERLVERIKPRILRRHPDLAAQLHILRGELAESNDNLQSASEAYGQALNAPSLAIKTNAYLKRIRVLKQFDMDACIGHLAVIIELLERMEGTLDDGLKSHFGRLYIERAWLLIQERPDAVRSDSDLERARQVLPPADTALWSEYHNARAGHVSHFKHDDALLSREIEMRQQAWVAASASGDGELMMRMAHNLGQAYVFSADYKSGLNYLTRCLELATTRQQLNMQAAAQKGIGGCHFFQQDYEAAQTAYENAYTLFEEIGNETWLAITASDLVELHATTGDFGQARRYLTLCQDLPNVMGNERYQSWLNDLNTRFPSLESSLNERQNALLHHLSENPPISRQDFIDLVGVSKSQAFRDLEELVEKGLIERIGKGRGTRYQRS